MKEPIYHNGLQSQLHMRQDEASGQKILVKTTDTADPSALVNMKLFNEFEILKDLDIKGVRKVVRMDLQGKVPELILEFVDGFTLSKYFTGGKHTLEEFLRIALQIVEALDGLHRARIIHKDINPENILISKDDLSVRLIDFGISGKMDLKLEHLGNPERLQGTLRYISPEQTGRMDRVVDKRSDLYSLGVTFYELLTGKLPFEGDSPLELVHAHLAHSPAPPASFTLHIGDGQAKVPVMLSDIVMHMLAKDPQDRYKGTSGLFHDLGQCLANLKPDGSIDVFTLRGMDVSDRFILPEKLYGMDEEVSFLKQKFSETGKGATEIVMIRGYSGVGKSALVRALYRELSGMNALLISGKFDQLQKNIPHSAFVSAFSGLVSLLLSENDIQLAQWRDKISLALGGLGKVLTHIVPDLEKLIGIQEEVPGLPTIEAQNRLEFLMREFVKCIADKDHPLLLFIDDLQWADEASLAFLKHLCIDSSIEGLLLIGTYRNNEVDYSHPLHMTLEEIAAERQIHNINVGNLELDSVNQLVADTLGCPPPEALDFSKLIVEKTGGNAFFVFQFLRSLFENGGITFNYSTRHWDWNHSLIKEMGITDNVVDLLSRSLNKLPYVTVEALKMASCMGNTFRLDYLGTILGEAAEKCYGRLEAAVQEGFIAPIQSEHWGFSFITKEIAAKMEFSFRHDKIQQAVYGLIPRQETDALHLRIGRLLLEAKSREEVQLDVFEIVNHLNHGLLLIDKASERTHLAGLNLIAGKKARQSAAYGQALVYFEAGMKLLDEHPWQHQYAICLELYTGAAECAYLSGNPERMEAFVAEVFGNAKDILDKILVYNTLVDAYTAGHNLPKAISAGLEALSGLGVRFPSNPKMLHIFQGLGMIKMKLAGKKIENLIDLPEMTDPYMLQAMPLMERISPAAYMSGSHLFPLLVFRMVDISLKYGNSSLSAFGYASFAITLSGVLGDYDGGLRFAEMSKKLLEKYQDEVYKVKVYFVNYCFIRHWKMHGNRMIEPLMEAYRSGLMAGNLFSGNWVACYALTWRYFTAQSLGQLKPELESFTSSFRQLKQYGAFNLADILQHTVNRLSDPDHVSTILGNKNISEAAILQRCFDAHDKTAVFFLHLNRMQLNYLFGDYNKALLCAKDAEEYLDAVVGLHYIPLYHFYRSLIILANPGSGKAALKSVRGSIKKMKLWAKHAPENYLHKLHLMEAEWALRHKDNDNARIAFDKAISLSRESGYRQEEAIALERASLFYAELGIAHLSQSLRQEMIKAYSQWGALAKLKQLGVKNINPESNRPFSGNTMSFTTDGMGTAILDMESILKASAMLAGEIEPDRLIPGFMRIMMENSGADRGVLLLSEHDKLHIRAGVKVKSQDVEMVDILFGDDLSGTDYDIPLSVIRFSMNSLKVISINDTGHDHDFRKDPYFSENQVKALICFPILNQNKLVGMVYLENSLLQDVFSKERNEVLNIIGSQFAVTLENIRLYHHTRQLNKSYERFVPKQFLAYLGKDSILDVQLGDHAQREMTIMFLDIRGFTSLSEQMTPQDNFFFINEFLGIMEPVVMKYGGFIDKYIGDAIMALFPESVDKAIEAGIAMSRELKKFNEARRSKQQADIRIGIGMHTGPIMLGTIGGNVRMDTTVIADGVNIASRVEQLNKEYGTTFLVTGATMDRLTNPGAVKHRKIGEVPVYGKEQKITIYEIGNELFT